MTAVVNTDPRNCRGRVCPLVGNARRLPWCELRAFLAASSWPSLVKTAKAAPSLKSDELKMVSTLRYYTYCQRGCKRPIQQPRTIFAASAQFGNPKL